MSFSEINIRSSSVSKIYPVQHGIIRALSDISFEVKAGESLGIIGRNGAGKSTLLKILSGVIKPTSGKVEYNGNIASILDLGWSFHPRLTGLSNIMHTARLNGISKKETGKKIDEILEFSELDGSVLHRPTYTYSSGMYLRLAFATILAWPARTMIFDEVITVGDGPFIVKSSYKLKELKNKGHSIILVSHSMEQVTQFCDKVMLLIKGENVFCGQPQDAIKKYQSFSDPYEGAVKQGVPAGVFFEGVDLTGAKSKEEAESYCPGASISAKMEVGFDHSASRKDFCVVINDFKGRQLFEDTTFEWSQDQLAGSNVIEWLIPENILNKGIYTMYIFWFENRQLTSYTNAISFKVARARPDITAADTYSPFHLKGAFKRIK